MAFELKVDVDEVYQWPYQKYKNWHLFFQRRADDMKNIRDGKPVERYDRKPENEAAQSFRNSPFFAMLPKEVQDT